MYYLRYIMYVIVSMIGGIILTNVMPGTTLIPNACWCVLNSVLFEIIEWKHNIVEDENNG
jgi:hypothetical protein